jgi:DNA polymerase (family 10)
MERREILAALEEMALLMTIDGANPFKVRAFENAARAIEAEGIDPAKAVADGSLGTIKGIGASLQEIITALVMEGSHPDLDELRSRIPAGVAAMTAIPGFGPKKAAQVFQERQIDSIEALEAALKSGALDDLRGFGQKTRENILKGIAQLRQHSGRHRLDTALEAIGPILAALGRLPSVERLEPAGSLRRRRESVHDIDVVVATSDPGAVMAAFVTLAPGGEVLAHGTTKSSIRLASGIQVDCRCVNLAQFPHTLQHFTGSKEHNILLRARARKMGLKVSEWGLFPLDADGGEEPVGSGAPGAIYCPDEAAFYQRLGLQYIPPEMREGADEIELAELGRLPRLVQTGDLISVLHCHSTYSDGQNTLDDMARTCAANGYRAFAICDHSKAAHYANGLTPERVRKQWEHVGQLQPRLTAEFPGFELLRGIEADILPDGLLDYHNDGDLLDGFDVVVGSIHSSFKLDRDTQTRRVLRAIDDPRLTIVGHPTGRLILAREGYDIDLEAVVRAAAAAGVAIEINGNPHRLDIDWRFGRLIRETGVMIAIGPDAHDLAGLDHMEYGLWMARKMGLEARQILNTLDGNGIRAFARARRQR